VNTLERAIIEASERLAEAEAPLIAAAVVEAAALYWAENPGDFGVQSASGGVIVFGGSNRVRWSPLTGFVLLDQHSPPFAEHFARVGAPLPRAR